MCPGFFESLGKAFLWLFDRFYKLLPMRVAQKHVPVILFALVEYNEEQRIAKVAYNRTRMFSNLQTYYRRVST
jgi:hypothetical protein